MEQVDIEKYREALKSHLVSALHCADEVADEWIAFIEGPMSERLHANLNTGWSIIYEETSRDKVFALRRQCSRNSSLSSFNDANAGRLQQAIKHYAAFLDSKFNPAKQKMRLGKKEKEASATVSPTPQSPVATPRLKLTEGAVLQQRVTKHERNADLRRQCLGHFGYRCQACGFDFEERYGDYGKEFIEVHHLVPISLYDDEHTVDPEKDLVPLCSNCHSIIHRIISSLDDVGNEDPDRLRKTLDTLKSLINPPTT